MSGNLVSHYRILEQIGSGGMGVVFKAEDTRLHRFVALKFLPENLSHDPHALQRFTREARAASALNHANICTVHDVDEHQGRPFIVMELLEGRTLKERIAGPRLATADVIDLAVQIVDALEAAHIHGIIHRDLKPANIFVTARDKVKVLDFGLAKIGAAPRQKAGTSTLTELFVTGPGTTVGTVAYMSPEQARGEEVDARSDLFSFGVVLYEMATARLPFEGETAAVVFEGILARTPAPPSKLCPGMPAEFVRIVLKALEKDLRLRYQTAGDLRADLERLKRALESGPSAQAITPRVERRTVFAALAVVALVVAGVAGWLLIGTGGRDTTPRSAWIQLTSFNDSAQQPALSGDGRMLTFIRGPGAFLTDGQIYVKMLPDGEPKQLTNDRYPKMGPVFSADGSRIAYTANAAAGAWDTWVVPVLGGEPRLWLPNASGLVWIDRSRILYSEIKTGFHMALVTATESRAGARDVYVPAHERGMAHRSWISPDGKAVLIAEMDPGGWMPCRLVPFDGGSPGHPVGPRGRCLDAAWSPDGKWMYFSAEVGGRFHIWRQRFPDGPPEQLTFGPTEEQGIAMSPDGKSFVTAAGIRQGSVWIRDASGERQVSLEGDAAFPSIGDGNPGSVFSPDGSKLYYLMRKETSRSFASGELWVADLGAGRNEVLLPGIVMSSYDISHDGRSIVFAASEADGKSWLWLASLDRRFPPRRLPQADAYGPVFAPSGDVYFRATEGRVSFVYRMRKDGMGIERVLTDPVIQPPILSPDGKWLIVIHALSGDRPFGMFAYPTREGPRLRVCDGCYLRWSRDGKFLFFSFSFAAMSGGKTFVIRLEPGHALPTLPVMGLLSDEDVARLPVDRVENVSRAFPGPDGSVYAFRKEIVQANLYRIPVP